MEMRAGEDIGRGEDFTPPLPPLAFSLHDSFLHSHCSACSFPLPNAHFTPTSPSNSPPLHYYCSPRCSALDSPPFMCPPPPLEDSSHLRLSLRLLHKLFHSQNDTVEVKLDRIGGLMTNYEKFLNLSENEEEDEVLEMVKEGARAMKLLAGKLEGVVGVEEAVMCLVLTNAVEVQDKDGRNVGIAVYDWRFSWINHSCSPNACFRFVTTKTIPPQQAVEGESQLPRLRIYPAAMDGGAGDGLDGDCKSSEGCGPSIIVRSIKGIKKNERIPITYTDLFQPKEMRQAELFTNYWFNCCCKRCTATPATYIDRALQEIFVSGVDGLNLISNEDSYRSKATAKFMDSIDGAIDEHLNFNNPESCCEKLEDLLTHGHPQEPLKPKPEKSPQCIRLHLFHHQSLHAYTTTLASAYRVRASDLLAFNPENHQHQMEAFTLSRISAAYSLLLAIVTHHLFLSESSIIACAVNFWKNAGESLVYLFRSSAWGTFSNLQQSVSENSSILNHKCYQIVQLDSSEANSFINTEDQCGMFGDISRQHINCIVNLTEKIWSFLSHESRHLQEVKGLIDFRWLLTVETPLDLGTRLTCRDSRSVSRLQEKEHTNLERAYLFQLGLHCLHYATIFVKHLLWPKFPVDR